MSIARAALFGFIFIAAVSLVAGSNAKGEYNPTFSKDVAPIIFSNCTSCHRPGEIAPMAFRTYKEVRPWAKAIRQVVAERTMPPWGADPGHGEFSNNRALTQPQIDTILNWIDSGAGEGNPNETPAPPVFTAGWMIGTPDVVFTMEKEFKLPSDGVLPYQNYRFRTGFTEDKYIETAEIRPGNRSVVHHAVAFVEDPNGRWLENMITGIAPGRTPGRYKNGRAKLIPRGSTIVLNMHYTPNGGETTDRTSIGFIFAKKPVTKKVITAISGTNRIDIPPGASDYELRSSFLFKQDSHIESLNPHMHARGKDFLYTLVYPDGTSRILLWVPRYNFNWQMGYALKEPIAAPKGSRLECVAHYDNSTKNRFNPDPNASVTYGEQTWNEMMAGYLEYTVDSENLQDQAANNRVTTSNSPQR